MIKKDYIIISILLAIIIIFAMLLIFTIQSPTLSNQMPNHITLANNSDEPGTVEVIKGIGNPDGEKIAYVVGIHPLEHLTHKTLLKLLPNITDLNYCYDIYIINVTQDVGAYGSSLYDDNNDPGRQNGQNLAYKYVYPEIQDGDYKLAIDVHSNVGAYDYKTFVFSPVKGGLGDKYAMEVSNNCPDIAYFPLESTTSGPYLTIPLNNNGVPAFYFEEYSFADQSQKDQHMMELISAVDGLKFN